GVLLPPHHRLLTERTVAARELAQEAFVHFPREAAPSLFDQIGEVFRTGGFTPRVVQEARDWMTEISLVEAGLGIAIVPSSFQRLRWGKVSYRPLTPPMPQATVALCYLRDRAPATAMAFIEIARDVLFDRTTGATIEMERAHDA
ncbi:MAG TPA: LysR family substrate-binding domain-containing protein, partial [Rhodothermales bacterium]|nr:LysR family substrate-binding domain-containing protein [Rhodothermales bacterium]